MDRVWSRLQLVSSDMSAQSARPSHQWPAVTQPRPSHQWPAVTQPRPSLQPRLPGLPHSRAPQPASSDRSPHCTRPSQRMAAGMQVPWPHLHSPGPQPGPAPHTASSDPSRQSWRPSQARPATQVPSPQRNCCGPPHCSCQSQTSHITGKTIMIFSHQGGYIQSKTFRWASIRCSVYCLCGGENSGAARLIPACCAVLLAVTAPSELPTLLYTASQSTNNDKP